MGVVRVESDDAFLRQAVAEIPWRHHPLVLNKVTAASPRIYDLRATAQLGWSRKFLLDQTKAQAYERSLAEKNTHNFTAASPNTWRSRR